MMLSEAVIRQYTIYARPQDFPGIPFVVRRWSLCPNAELVLDGFVEFCNSLEAAREFVPLGMICVGRDPTDPPTIVECWI